MPLSITGLQVLESLDIIRNLAKEDDTHKLRFKFKPALKVALSKRMRALVELNTDINELRTNKMKELGITGEQGADGKSKDDPVKLRELQKYWEEVLADKYDIEIGKLKLSWFELETNDVPFTSLTVLDWLIDMDIDEADLDKPAEPKAK